MRGIAATLALLSAGPAATIEPFATVEHNASASDWALTPAAGMIERLLNGAPSSRTRIEFSGYVAGPADAEVAIGIYADGELVGNRVLTTLQGAGAPIAVEVGATYVAAADVILEARAAASEDADYAFSDFRLAARKA